MRSSQLSKINSFTIKDHRRIFLFEMEQRVSYHLRLSLDRIAQGSLKLIKLNLFDARYKVLKTIKIRFEESRLDLK